MKIKFQTIFNGCLAVVLLAMLWPAWTGQAQTTNTNAAPGASVAVPANESPEAALARYVPTESNVTPGWVNGLSENHPFLKRRVMGNELWKYLASMVYIFLAFYIAKLLDHLTRAFLKKWNKNTATKFDYLLFELLNGPVKVVVFMIFLHIGLDIFTWPARAQILLKRGFTVVTAAALTYLVMKLVNLALDYWRDHSKAADADRTFDHKLFPLIRRSLKVFVVIVAVMVTAQNLNINVTAAIASLSIGGLAVGLAAQDTLANLFGTVAILLDKPFRVGDRVNVGLPERIMEGTVESIGLRSSRFRSNTGYLITIPNKAVSSATIINISRRHNLRTEMNLSLATDTSVEKLKRAVAILQEVLPANPKIQDLAVTMNTFSDSSMNIQVTYAWHGLEYTSYLAAMQELNLALKVRFDVEGIKLASPLQITYLK